MVMIKCLDLAKKKEKNKKLKAKVKLIMPRLDVDIGTQELALVLCSC